GAELVAPGVVASGRGGELAVAAVGDLDLEQRGARARVGLQISRGIAQAHEVEGDRRHAEIDRLQLDGRRRARDRDVDRLYRRVGVVAKDVEPDAVPRCA